MKKNEYQTPGPCSVNPDHKSLLDANSGIVRSKIVQHISTMLWRELGISLSCWLWFGFGERIMMSVKSGPGVDNSKEGR